MFIKNYTGHNINVYNESAFINLEQLNPTTWVADGVNEEAIAVYESEGSARISVTTVLSKGVFDQNGVLIPAVQTVYGQVTGVPDSLGEDTLLVVSLPTQGMAKQAGLSVANQMVTPYKVVRQRGNTSNVIGCMGISFQ